MAVKGAGRSIYDAAAKRREQLTGASGPLALVKNGKVFRIAAFACIGGILYGYNQGMFSGVLQMPSFKSHMGVYDPFDSNASQTKKGWLTAILELGAYFGALMSGFIAEALSRKYGILAADTVFIIGVVIQACSQKGGYHTILAGRFITGIGVGALATIIPIYNSECAPTEVRGSLVALQQLAIAFGIMISFWIDYGTNYIGGTTLGHQKDTSWLLPICLQLAPAAILFVGMVFMPYSPRWLIHHDREEEARKVLASLRNLQSDDNLLELEFLEIKAQSMWEKRTTTERFPHLTKQTTWNILKLQFVAIKSLFQTKAMFKRVAVSTITMFFQQWTGFNAVMYYAPTIFSDMGMSSNTTDLLATGVQGIMMFLSTIPTVLYIDKVGRRPVLTIGAIGMAICHFIIAGIIARNMDHWETSQGAAWAAVVFVWLFVLNFGYSWGPCGWIIVAEIWPLSSRPYGTAVGASSNWMNNFIIGQITPDMLNGISYGTYIIFGVLTSIGAAFIWFFVPETKRVTLEEMDIIFGSEGVAEADRERMEEINNEIGLTSFLQHWSGEIPAEIQSKEDEKIAGSPRVKTV